MLNLWLYWVYSKALSLWITVEFIWVDINLKCEWDFFYNLWNKSLQFMKKKSNISKFVLWLSSSLYFGYSVRDINVNFKFCYFSAYFPRTLLNKADLNLAVQSKSVQTENTSVEICLLPSLLETLSPDIYLCLAWIVWPFTLQFFSR